jgi:RNA polymerase sigma-70 factor (ECF subfamily)
MVAKVPASSSTSLATALVEGEGPHVRQHVEPLLRSGTRAVEGNAVVREAALARLLTQHFRMVWRALRRLGVPVHAVDDAAQEVFLVASRKLDSIEAGQERRFLYGVSLRVAANARRARAARPETPYAELVEETASPAPSPEALLDRKRARELLDEALERLPDELRTVFVLVELEGCSGPEVAELCDIALGTAASRLRRAREAFHATVAELGRKLEQGVRS